MIGDGCVYRRCICVNPATGRQDGQDCPRLAVGGRYGSWYVRLELPGGLDGMLAPGLHVRATAEARSG